MKLYKCTNCLVGEIIPCMWLSNNPDNEKPISCPIGTHGEDAVWMEIAQQNVIDATVANGQISGIVSPL